MKKVILISLIALAAVGCSVTSSIKVKQDNGQMIQETEIQHEGSLQSLSLVFNPQMPY